MATDLIKEAKAVLGDEGFVLKKCNSEKDVKAEVRRFVRRYDRLWIFMPVQSGFGVSGTPDFVGCLNSLSFGIETKFGTAKSTMMQIRQQDDMETAGSTVFRDVSERNFSQFMNEWEAFAKLAGSMVI